MRFRKFPLWFLLFNLQKLEILDGRMAQVSADRAEKLQSGKVVETIKCTLSQHTPQLVIVRLHFQHRNHHITNIVRFET